MQNLIAKADTLLEALPYIQRFSGATFVIKYGGSFMDSPDPEIRNGVARDIVFLEAVEINPVVVHGGGKAITRAMEKAGLKATFLQGQRVTDEATVKIADEVLSREINPEVVAAINSLGGLAKGFAGPDIFRCRKAQVKGPDGQTLDLGYVGEVIGVNTAPLLECIEQGHHARHQPHRPRRGRQDLQLQRRRGRGAGGDCAQSPAPGLHERRARPACRIRRSRTASSPASRSARWTA